MRLAAAAAALCAVAVAAWAPTAHAVPPIARPNPALAPIRLDYVNPLPGRLSALRPAVAGAAGGDYDRLRYLTPDDLGGFVPAPVGRSALTGLARTLVRLGGSTVAPDDGRRPLPGIGVPPAAPPPGRVDSVPPPNQGFAGRRPRSRSTPPKTAEGAPPQPPQPSPATTTTATQPPPPPPPTTTTTTTPTGTTMGTPPPPPQPQPPGGGGGSPPPCRTTGLTIAGNRPDCGLYAVNMEPGDATSEVLTITNTSGAPATLSLRASGRRNHLWQDLRLGVWERGTAPPTPLPPLDEWTTQFNDLATLAAGESVAYVVELYLPETAGNEDQHLEARIDLAWREQG